MKKTTWAILILIIIVLCGITIYYKGNKNGNVTNTNEEVQNIDGLTDQDIILRNSIIEEREQQLSIGTKLFEDAKRNQQQTNDWKTYESKEYKLSFKYPSNYFVAEQSNDSQETFRLSVYEDNSDTREYLAETNPDKEPPPSITLIIVPSSPSKQTLLDWQPTEVLTKGSKSYEEQLNIYAEAYIDGHESLVFPSAGMYTSDIVMTKHGDDFLQSIVQYAFSNDPIQQTFYQILVTLKLQ